MTRRDFLQRLCLLGIGAAALPLFPAAAEASWYIPTALPGISVHPTYLQFGPLENRFFTNCIVVHHIGNTNADVSAETVHQWHLNNGWSGIGYHFLIRKDGTIEEGRPLGTVGAHVYGENRHTVGINVVGNFEAAVPTEAQKSAVAHLIASLCTVYQFDPEWEGTVFGHRDLSATACPGRYLYEQMPDIVEQSLIYYGSEELAAERIRIAQQEREEAQRQAELARKRIEERSQRTVPYTRPEHPSQSAQSTTERSRVKRSKK